MAAFLTAATCHPVLACRTPKCVNRFKLLLGFSIRCGREWGNKNSLLLIFFVFCQTYPFNVNKVSTMIDDEVSISRLIISGVF
ncbi:hypothetical protein DFO54_10380 [Erwinia sp. AG740]|nr:hypothetical protein DFO54_10380 [Erwinia sp. AG740]